MIEGKWKVRAWEGGKERRDGSDEGMKEGRKQGNSHVEAQRKGIKEGEM